MNIYNDLPKDIKDIIDKKIYNNYVRDYYIKHVLPLIKIDMCDKCNKTCNDTYKCWSNNCEESYCIDCKYNFNKFVVFENNYTYTINICNNCILTYNTSSPFIL